MRNSNDIAPYRRCVISTNWAHFPASYVLGRFDVTDAARPFLSCVFLRLQRRAVRMSAETPLDRAQFLAASAAVATSSAVLPLVALAEDDEVRTLESKSSPYREGCAHQTLQALDKTGRDLGQTDQDLDQIDQDLHQTDQDLHQTDQDLDQTYQDVDQTDHDLDQTDQDLDQTHQDLDQTHQDLQ